MTKDDVQMNTSSVKEASSLETAFKFVDQCRRQDGKYNQGKLVKVTQQTIRAAHLLAQARQECTEYQASSDASQLAKTLAEIG